MLGTPRAMQTEQQVGANRAVGRGHSTQADANTTASRRESGGRSGQNNYTLVTPCQEEEQDSMRESRTRMWSARTYMGQSFVTNADTAVVRSPQLAVCIVLTWRFYECYWASNDDFLFLSGVAVGSLVTGLYHSSIIL